MGCGGSKAAQVAPSTTSAPAQKVTEAAPANKTEAKPVASPAPAPAVVEGPTSTSDGKLVVTESSPNASIAAGIRPPTPDLTIEGKGAGGSVSEDVSNEPVPIIQNRPSSRGGMAFEITYDEPLVGGNRLETIKKRSAKKPKAELTIGDLQNKLDAAENRRKGFEEKLKDKMAKETEKVSSAQKPEKRPEETEEDRAEKFKILSEQIRLKNEAAPVRVTSEPLPPI